MTDWTTSSISRLNAPESVRTAQFALAFNPLCRMESLVSEMPVYNPLGIIAYVDVDPRDFGRSTTAKHTVRMTLERGCEALSGVHVSSSPNHSLHFDGIDEWRNPFVPQRSTPATPSTSSRELPTVQTVLSVRPLFMSDQDWPDEVHFRVDASSELGTVGPTHILVVPIVVRA